MKSVPSEHHVALGFASVDQDKLLEAAETTVTVAANSPLFTNPVIAASVADVTLKVTNLKTCASATAKTRAALEKNESDESVAQTGLVNAMTALGLLVQGNARSELEITGMAFQVREKIKIPRTTPDAPKAIDITTPPGAKAYATVSVHETGGRKGRYVAECTADPIGPWKTLVGTGKSRTVAAPSGSKIWVRFAQVRGQLQSEWSDPILVYIP